VRRLGAALAGLLLAGVLPSCGSPAAAGSGYRLPWPGETSFRVLQGPLVVDPLGACSSGCGSHRDQDGQHAWDFDRPEGTPVLAARSGTVGLAVGSWSADHCGGLTPVADQPPGYLVSQTMGNQANLVQIDHGDGTSALYLHLRSVDPAVEAKARTGAPVARGEVLGRSGKTGLTGCLPHLHFQVEKTVRADWYTTSLPISFTDPDVLARNPDGVPAEGGTYVSSNRPAP
jgi:murein DD-endopeptidase MepM/ murein hydrolase activator NlpD